MSTHLKARLNTAEILGLAQEAVAGGEISIEVLRVLRSEETARLQSAVALLRPGWANPFAILEQAKDRCTDWDGVIVLEACQYRLQGVGDGPSVVAQIMPEAGQ